MNDLKKAYQDFLDGWQNMTGPGGFGCFEAGYYHAQKTAQNSEDAKCSQCDFWRGSEYKRCHDCGKHFA